MRRLKLHLFNLIPAATHVALPLVLALWTHTPLTPALLVVVILFALLPDIDTAGSHIGRLVPPISRAIEQRFGHRTLTHSLLAVGAVAAASLALSLGGFLNPLWPWAPIAHLSHLLLDMVIGNRTGVPLFWPLSNYHFHLTIAGYYLDAGSRGERLILAALIIAGLIPVLAEPPDVARALHTSAGTIVYALEDYRAWQGEYIVYADVDGVFQATHHPVNARFEVLDARGTTFILRDLEDPNHAIYSGGQGPTDNIYLRYISLHPGPVAQVRSVERQLTDQPIGDLIPELEALAPTAWTLFVSGHIRTTAALPEEQALTRLPRFQRFGDTYQAAYLTRHDITALAAVPVQSADLIIHAVYAETGDTTDPGPVLDAEYEVSPTPTPTPPLIAIRIPNVYDLTEIRIRPDDTITRGQLLADLTGYRATLPTPTPAPVAPTATLILNLDAARVRVDCAQAELAEKQRWLATLESLGDYDHWGDLPYLIGSQAPAGHPPRSDLIYRERLAQARHNVTLAQADLALARIEERRAQQALIPTAPPIPIPNPARADTYVRALIAGRVQSVEIVAITGNVATVEIRVEAQQP